MGSPLTLGKSKRWLARHRVTWGAPGRCAARECVQERRRAATERRFRQLVDRTGIVFSVLFFLSHSVLSASRSGIRQQAQLAHHCLLINMSLLLLLLLLATHTGEICVCILCVCVICTFMCMHHYVIMHPLMVTSPLSRYNVPI